MVSYLQIFAPGAAFWWFWTHQNHLSSLLSWQKWTWHICQVKKNTKTAVVLIDTCQVKKTAKLQSSYLPVSPSRVLRAPGTSPYHLVPKHLRTTWYRPEQSHLLPEACSPNCTDLRRQRQRQTERPPPEPSDIFKRFSALYDDKLRYSMMKVSKSELKGLYKKWNFCMVSYLQIFAPGAALWWFQTYQDHLPSLLSWQNWTWHICQVKKNSKTAVVLLDTCQVKKNSKTAVVLLAGVTISGTPCSRHYIVPFFAEAPSDHVVQAWAIPPPSWGLLSQWHRQETTTLETNGASSARTQRHS